MKAPAQKFHRCVSRMIRLFTLISLASAPLLAEPSSHPFLFFSQKDLPEMQEKVARVEWSEKAWNQMIQAVDAHPEFKAPPPNSLIRSQWLPTLRENCSIAQYAAFLYQINQDKAYLEKAKSFLFLYAREFENSINFHNIDDKDGIVIYETGRLGIHCAWTYDMIYNDLTPAERDVIENQLLRPIVDMIRETVNQQNMQDAWAGKSGEEESASTRARDYDWGPGQWNGNMYCNAGITAIGFVLRDPEIYEHGIRNWKTYLARDMLADGMWQEEDFYYSRFCYSSMQTVAEMAYQYGYPEDLYNLSLPSRPPEEWDPGYVDAVITAPETEDPGYRTMRMFLDAQIDYQYPDLSAGNWGWQTNNAAFNTGSHVTFFELGYLRHKEPVYGWVLQNMDRSRGNQYVQGLASPILYGGEISSEQEPDTASRWYSHGKWIILKSVEGRSYWNSDALYAFMPYGAKRTKGLRPFSVDLFAFGKTIAPRVSKTSRHQAHDKDYYLHDDAWNSYMIDGENLSGIKHLVTEDVLGFHDFNPEFKIAQAHLEVERHLRPSIWYPDVVERRPELDYHASRTIGLSTEYMLDITHLRFLQYPKYKHNFEWIWHAHGELTLEGISHDQNSIENWSATWLDTDGIGMVTHMLGSGKGTGTRIAIRNDTITNYIRVMRGNEQETFVAIHEPFRNEPQIDHIEKLYQDTQSVALAVHAPDQYIDYICVAFAKEGMALDSEDVSVDTNGHYAYLRVTADRIIARGDITSFRIPAGNIQEVILNDSSVPFKFSNGYIAYHKPAQ